MKKIRKLLMANRSEIAIRVMRAATELGIRTVGTVAAKVGQSVKRGSPLLSIEAMKMESVITAERDGSIARIHVVMGDKIEAKDLLLEFK